MSNPTVRLDVNGTVRITNGNSIVSWMVIGERKDDFIKQWNRTNSNGYLITEHNKDV